MRDARTLANVAILAACQALFISSMSILITLGSLVGYDLADDKAFATLPVTSVVTGTALATVPASFIMRWIGRRAGFMVGTCFGFFGALIAGFGVYAESFWIFSGGTMLVGMFAGFAHYYRFAAADVAAAEFRPKAIALVLAGGLVAGFAGPEIAKWTKDLVAAVTFLGCYLAVAGLMVATMLLLAFLSMPRAVIDPLDAPARPLGRIVANPVFLVAVASGMIGYGVMSLIMTSTPLAMVIKQHSFDTAATVIQWHVIGMYAPSFFTGSLIRRFGAPQIIVVGGLLNLACVAAASSGDAVLNYWIALALLGVGWNFMFIGATTLVTELQVTSEMAKTQAVNDFLIFGTVASASLLSGQILHRFGWDMVTLSPVPFLLLAIAGAIWLVRAHRRRGVS